MILVSCIGKNTLNDIICLLVVTQTNMSAETELADRTKTMKIGSEPVAREELMKSLELHEQALFRFLEHLQKIEEQALNLPATEPKPRISWNGGKKTQDLINSALDYQYLPLSLSSYGSAYEVMGWEYAIDSEHPEVKAITDKMDRREKYEYLEEYHRGSFDIRIMLYDEGDKKTSLRFFANLGGLAKMDTDFHKAFDSETYPVICEDRDEYHYENPAYTALSNSQKSTLLDKLRRIIR